MQKNKYVKPIVVVYTVACENRIMAGSGDPTTVSSTPATGTANTGHADSRDGSMWDDDDNE